MDRKVVERVRKLNKNMYVGTWEPGDFTASEISRAAGTEVFLFAVIFTGELGNYSLL